MGRKVSDFKSIKVGVPASTVITQGRFYVLEGFFGMAVQSLETDANGKVISFNGSPVPAGALPAEVVLNVEEGVYETDQITAADAFAKGDKVYWDAANQLLTTQPNNDASGNPQNRPVGRVTQAKDVNNVIWFALGPQVQAHA